MLQVYKQHAPYLMVDNRQPIVTMQTTVTVLLYDYYGILSLFD